MLLNLLRWISANTDIYFEVLLRTGGHLASKFAELGPVHTFPFPPGPLGLFGSLVNFRKRKLAHLLDTKGFSLVYSNTIVSGDVLEVIHQLDIPIITHVHELETVIGTFPDQWSMAKRYTDAYVAASHAVKENLVTNHAIADNAVTVVHESIPVPPNAASNQIVISGTFKETLGISSKSFLVCGCGTIEQRKGTDLFVSLAHATKERLKSDDVHFIWIGGHHSKQEKQRVLGLVEELGVEEYMTFTGAIENPVAYFRESDVFAMVSREDPFPLVCLEAASVELPILCFANAGGMPEFVEDDAGFVLPNQNIEEMAAKIIDLYRNPELRKNLGLRAKEKFEKQFSHDRHCKQILRVIETQLASIPT